MTVIVNQAAIQALIRDPDGPVVEIFRSLVRCTEARAKVNVKVDTGLLRSSITSSVDVSGSTIKGTVTADALYADFVESGTGIYGPKGTPIKPRRGKYLVFKGAEGDTVFARQVKGSRPAPFMAPSFEDCLRQMTGD